MSRKKTKPPKIPKRPPKALTKKEAELLHDRKAWGRERVRQASEYERWSDHPGQAKLMCELRVYYPPKNCYLYVPGWNLKVILEPTELDGLESAISWGVQKWIEGKLAAKGFTCPECGTREELKDG